MKFQKESSLSAVAVEMEEDVTSSLNTLLDARPDSATPAPRSDSDPERDRYVSIVLQRLSSSADIDNYTSLIYRQLYCLV